LAGFFEQIVDRFFTIKNIFPELAYAAASLDRELIALGMRLGENDNWIAAFCRYYSLETRRSKQYLIICTTVSCIPM
jgi:predicted nucleic acid-binding protein